MHGLGACKQQTISGLAQLEDTQLISVDFPAHGESIYNPTEKLPLSFDAFADAVIALMDQLELQTIDIGGLSMGSGVALNIALRYPERVKRLILLRPSWLDQPEPSHLAIVARVGQWIEQYGINKAAELLNQDSEFQSIQQTNQNIAHSLTALFERPQAISGASVLYTMWQDKPFHSLAGLSSISVPALVLQTGEDILHPLSVAEFIHQALPHSRLETLPPRYVDGQGYAKALLEQTSLFLQNTI